MGAFKKSVRSDVRRAARLVIGKYYQQTKGKSLSEKRLKDLVRQTEKQAVPAIIGALKKENRGNAKQVQTRKK